MAIRKKSSLSRNTERARGNGWPARRAYRRVLQYIHARNLTPGSRLPRQVDLCKELNIGTNTLDAAMQLLVKNGVVSRRQKSGTIVADPHQVAHATWTVGLTLIETGEPSGYFGLLHHFLRQELVRAGCSDRTFLHRTYRREMSPADFVGLPEAIAAGEIDALITDTGLEAPELLICHLGVNPNARFGIRHDTDGMVRSATEQSLLRGCRRIGLVGPVPGSASALRQCQNIQQVIARSAISATVESFAAPWPHLMGGQQVARELLSRPVSARPDGLICLDDHAAAGLTHRLRDDADYRPQIASQTNKQAPMLFALPVIRFEVDIEEYAWLAVRKVMAQLLHLDQALTMDLYQMRLIPEEELVGPCDSSDTPLSR